MFGRIHVNSYLCIWLCLTKTRYMKYVKHFFRLLLGAFMTYAGISHLTFNRQEFVAQVPTWLQFNPEFTDFVVLASGVVEIAFGLGLLLLVANKRAVCGALLAIFYVARQHQSVCEPYRCFRPEYGSSSSYPSFLPARTHLFGSMDNRRLEILETMVER